MSLQNWGIGQNYVPVTFSTAILGLPFEQQLIKQL